MATKQTLKPRTEDMIALVAGLEARGETRMYIPEPVSIPKPITFISDDTAEMLLKIALAGGSIRPEALVRVEDDFIARTNVPSYLQEESSMPHMLDKEQSFVEEQKEHPLYIVTLMKQKLQAWNNAFDAWNESLETEAQKRLNDSKMLESPAE